MISEFDSLDFFDANILDAKIEGNRIEITMENVGFFPSTPLRGEAQTLALAKLLFEGVVFSHRTIHEYTSVQQETGFKPPFVITDGPFTGTNAPTKHYHLEGVQKIPPAWIDWEIESTAFVLRIMKEC